MSSAAGHADVRARQPQNRAEGASLIADDLYLLVRHHRTGRALIDPRAFEPLMRVGAALQDRAQLSVHDAVLTGLAVASVLWLQVAGCMTSAGRSLDIAVIQLPAALRELIMQAQAAAGGTVLSGRSRRRTS